ncbi:hypothetical protein PTKIN_Ptkin07bG0291000 [Pterospermum kingtungense]
MESESEKTQGSTALCQRKFDENAGFVANMRNQWSEFIHAPMDERKACLKETYQKVINSWDEYWNCSDKFERFKSVFTFKKD